MEMTLGNPTCPGCGSSTDISLIDPYVYFASRLVSLTYVALQGISTTWKLPSGTERYMPFARAPQTNELPVTTTAVMDKALFVRSSKLMS